MKGTYHDVAVIKDKHWGAGIDISLGVELCNEDDGYYAQYFESRGEIDELIGRLKAARDEAWPPEASNEKHG